ncbi:MAG: large conductance mechanosensitive channel protein MscL [Actinomycetota bacterium]
MLKEFKEFALKGNLIEIAVGLILALAFAAVVTSLTTDIIAPIIGAIFGQPNFEALVIDVGDAQIRYGAFITVLINFLIVAFVLFLIVKAANKLLPKKEVDSGPTEIELLTEIRDSLKSRNV